MQSHRGLPKNLPQRKTRAKIISTCVSPCHTNQSPSKSDSMYKSSPSKTPDRESSVNRSQHRLNSKQKPISRNSIMENSQKRQQLNPSINVNNFDDNVKQNKQEIDEQVKYPIKHKQTQFVKSVLGMMGNLGKPQQITLKRKQKTQNNYKEININDQLLRQSTKVNKLVPAPRQIAEVKQLKYNDNQQENKLNIKKCAPSSKHINDQQILGKCAQMLSNNINWSNYSGQVVKNKKVGFGILYFYNGDKFIGAFKDDKASGHGTYYDISQTKRILGIWENNMIKLNDEFIIQNY